MPNTQAIRKIFSARLHWLVWIICLSIASLFSAYIIGVKAVGGKVFAGTIVYEIPEPICSYYKTCAACAPCSCGPHSSKGIAFVFGREARSFSTICQKTSAIPRGTGGLRKGSVVFGMCPTMYFTSNDGVSCNVWSTMQAKEGSPFRFAIEHQRIPADQIFIR